MGVDIYRQLVVAQTCLDFIGFDGTPFSAPSVICVAKGKILIASESEFPYCTEEEYLVDNALWNVERQRFVPEAQ